MHNLNPADQLISQQQYGLQREFTATVIEQVLQAWSKHFDDHDMIGLDLPIPNEFWKALLF